MLCSSALWEISSSSRLYLRRDPNTWSMNFLRSCTKWVGWLILSLEKVWQEQSLWSLFLTFCSTRRLHFQKNLKSSTSPQPPLELNPRLYKLLQHERKPFAFMSFSNVFPLRVDKKYKFITGMCVAALYMWETRKKNGTFCNKIKMEINFFAVFWNHHILGSLKRF